MSSSLRTIVPLALALVLLISYGYITANDGNWHSPPSGTVAPDNNTLPPINVCTITQTKSGNLVVNTLAAVTEVRSDRYCNALGANCFAPPLCSVGQSMVVDVTGNWVCKTPTCTVRFDSTLGSQVDSEVHMVDSGSTPRIGLVNSCNQNYPSSPNFTNRFLNHSRNIDGWSDAGHTSQLGWWTELNYLNNQSRIDGLSRKDIKSFIVAPGVTQTSSFATGCGHTGSITVTVVSSP
jgi:hypothetical protein